MRENYSRKIGHKGSFTLPKEMRQRMGLDGRFVQIESDAEGRIILTPYNDKCAICGKINPEHKVGKRAICSPCAGVISEVNSNV